MTSAVGFIVGFALFGAITYLPLYLQVTKGSSPTRSGLQLTPLMAGVLVTSIVSGQVISRIGRYRVLPDRGHGDHGGRDGPARPAATPARARGSLPVFACVLGLGLGMVMQVLVLAVQNSVDPSMMGVATSGSTLFRQIGGSIGVALFGTIFANRVHVELAARPAGGIAHPEDDQPRGHPAAAARRARTRSPMRLPPRCIRCSSTAAGVSVLAFALTWLLREVPLRTKAQGRRGDLAAGRAREPRNTEGRSRHLLP